MDLQAHQRSSTPLWPCSRCDFVGRSNMTRVLKLKTVWDQIPGELVLLFSKDTMICPGGENQIEDYAQ